MTCDPEAELSSLIRRLADCLGSDRPVLARQLQGVRRRLAAGKPVDRGLADARRAIEASSARVAARAALVSAIQFPEELPVSARREEIARLVAGHQVVVIAGETGSGKTTQLPKICLQMGFGRHGRIGHTQPRRIAARSVAARIAEELQTPLGQAVGYKVRFSDRISDHTRVKLLTDGMLLAEIQGDPLLMEYDAFIIDEAHERSLNIDFLLGYLRGLLPRRPDLKLIITSATINTESFSRFFGGAPVLEVSGRTYPVEILYRPLAGDEEERDRTQADAIIDAADELTRLDPLGDILVFLPGEREIRETADALRRLPHKDTEILPLFSRLSAAEQDRVFKPHTGRRIVLATNVAETSLTVPGIRFVIDTGYARMSRYSHRTKVQRLPIEPVAQAAANQRAGRCGRVGPGICVRLYGQEDFQNRSLFTEPEILRTNLASVILQMMALGLGDPESFPFMEPPDRRYINDGYRVLQELGAVDAGRRITDIGRQLARLPVDPRLGRMLLAADQERCLTEMLVVAAALAISDPRERPLEAQQKADACHGRFADERSDFLAYLKLWSYYTEQARHLSQNKLRKLCKEEFLSYVRLREWREIHGQLAAVAEELHLRLNEQEADYDAVHRAVLAGFLSQVAVKDEPEPGERRKREQHFLGTRNLRLSLFPGSGVAKKPPKWIVAAELTETARLFARTNAAIRVEWIEQLAPHLLKRSWSEPHWEKKAGQVIAYEQATLYGLVVVAGRRVNYGAIDPKTSQEIFIREALVCGEFQTPAPFFRHNRALAAQLQELEAKTRRRDVLVDEHYLCEFYAARLPASVYDAHTLERWRRDAERTAPDALFLTRDELLRDGMSADAGADFPGTLVVDGLSLPLRYRFAPGDPDDGVTAIVPVAALAQLAGAPLEWLVPGLLEEKMTGLIKTLPKPLRRNFIPAADFARTLARCAGTGKGSLTGWMAQELGRTAGVELTAAAFAPERLPPHLHINLHVVDERGKELGRGRDLASLRAQLAPKVQAAFEAQPFPALERTGIVRWDFGPLEEVVRTEQNGVALRAWPALVDRGEDVALRLFNEPQEAMAATRAGLRRLFMLALPEKVKYLKKSLPGLQTLCLHYAPLGSCDELKEDLVRTVFDKVCMGDPWPRDAEVFAARVKDAGARLLSEANAVAAWTQAALAEYRALLPLLDSAAAKRLHAADDVRRQLRYLVYRGFVAATPYERLRHLPRYLKAARLRLEKAERNPARDLSLEAELASIWTPLRERLDGGVELPKMLEKFRWAVEELRVGLFAQELKTAFPVSVPRLQKQWRELSDRRPLN